MSYKYYVVVYDRASRKLAELREFGEEDRASAETFRLRAQRTALDQHLDQEIVLFQAESEEALRRTHGAYFLSEADLIERALEAAEAS